MGDRVFNLSQDEFVAIWNSSESLAEAAARVKQAVGGIAPRWAVMARADKLRSEGVELKELHIARAA